MLDVLNRYAHGFVVVPVVLACRKGGVFTSLNVGPRAAEELSKELGSNLGHLQVALRMFESLGWVDRREDRRYVATASLKNQLLLPDGLSALVQADMDAYLRSGVGGFLTPWLEKVRSRWSITDDLLADYCDSLLVVPVLALLAKRGLLKDLLKHDFRDLPEGVRAEVVSLMEILGWIEGSSPHYQLTAPGNFMFERAMNLGVAESYRPMLCSMERILFEDAGSVFVRNAEGHETHVERSMNVISSGFQHDRYFAEVEGILVSIFSREPFSAQPKYVADMGSGDGTFLKRVYQTVRDKTPRGKQLSNYPLTLVGIDLNQASLNETSRTLTGIDHLLVTGDIGNPKKVAEDLAALGVDLNSVLHIRSFLDHDRPYIAPADHVSLAAREKARYLGVYVDRKGNAIPPAAVIQSLVEHLQRWAGVVTEHGFILLEVHCQDPLVVRDHLDQSESLYFDAIESFSHQLLVEADVFLMAAAEAGLFPRRNYFRKFPGYLPYCRITLNLFERRPYRVRLARPSDMPALLRLEAACWPDTLRVSSSELQRRMDAYALGQWLLEMDGKVVGVIYSQRINDLDRLRECRLDELSSFHDNRGKVVQLLGLNVLPEMQHLGLGDQLLDLLLLRSSLQGGVRQVTGITRCKDFSGNSLEELDKYIKQRDASGSPIDPILKFHHSHGAKLLGTVKDYRPEDTDNLGAGVLLVYDLSSPYAALPSAETLSISPDEHTATDTKSRLEACLRGVLGPSRQGAFSWKLPLRELGLDSLNLLEFRARLEDTFGRTFSPTFFFSHPTLLDIYTYVDEAVTEVAPPKGATAGKRVRLEGEAKAAARLEPRAHETSLSAVGRHPRIAVIGMAGRFPGCANLDEYWDLLASGRDAITEIPATRWMVDDFYSPDPDAPGKIASRFGGFIENPDIFDASFFNISPREAQLMDPQQRLLLQSHWEALENAGIDPNKIREAACGFFVGLSSHDYESLEIEASVEKDLVAHYATGVSAAVVAGRLAYFFGTRGPAITLDTACSSSLVAIHQAIRSLQTGESELALASGINLILSPRMSIAYSKARMLSLNGRCKTFDADADGYVRSEGCGVVVLKRLEDAARDGDRVMAVICGSAINQDGASNGLTAPSLPAQEQLIYLALKDAGMRPADIDYIEAHGTGTSLGDPVEFKALQNVFQGDPGRTEALWLGSVKTNIGHAEGAAGIAGFIKVVLAMQRQWLPAHLHFKRPNPQINLDSLPARIPVQGCQWQRHDRLLRSGISSFGFSGTNAHVIVEQAPPAGVGPVVADRSRHLLALSARSGPALQALMTRYANWLPGHLDANLADICHTANAGRAHHDYRLAFAASTHGELARSLQEGLGTATNINSIRGKPQIAFLFTGQGSQYVGMARELSLTEPVFRATLAECRDILANELAQPLENILDPESGDPSALNETANTQPALFAVEYALARTLQSWGVQPDAVMGHSVGEYVAACIAGVFSLPDGLRLIAARGRLMQTLPRDGAMSAILGPADLVLQTLEESDGEVSVAAFNGPGNTVISGRRDMVEAIGCRLEKAGAKVVPLQVSHAFHSRLMEPILPTFKEVARWVRFSPPKLSFVSNLTGSLARDELTLPDYWVRHIREPVQFERGIQALVNHRVEIMLEIGPQPVLSRMGQACLQGTQSNAIEWLHTMAQGASDWNGVLASLSALYEHGLDIDWSKFDTAHPRRLVSLPTYPWQGERYWFEEGEKARLASASASDAFGRAVTEVRPADMLFEIVWQPAVSPGHPSPQKIPAANGAIPAAGSAWLIFEDSSPRSREVVSKLEALGHQVLRIRKGPFSKTLADGVFEVLATEPVQLEHAVTAALALVKTSCTHALCFWGSPSSSLADSPEALCDEAGSLCAESLLAAQALIGSPHLHKPRLWLATCGTQPVGGVVPDLRTASLWGLGRVLAAEHPEIWGGLVDLDPGALPQDNAAALVDCAAASAVGNECAFRCGVGFVPRLMPQPESTETPLEWPAEGCHLVSGGLGGVGLRIAEWLATQGARKIVLMGRTPLLSRRDGETVERGSRAFEQIAGIRGIESHGAAVKAMTVDIADENSLRQMLQALNAENWLPICGVIHAASANEDCLAMKMDAAAFKTGFRSKVLGALNLEKCLADQPLQYFVCCSSIASLLSLSGQAGYSSANAFLDGFVHRRRSRQLPALGVNWGGWRDTGLALTAGGKMTVLTLAQRGFLDFSPAEGTSALELLLRRRSTQAIVLRMDWARFRQASPAGRPLLANLAAHPGPAHSQYSESSASTPKQSTVSDIRRLLAAAAGRQQAHIMETWLREQAAQVLHVPAFRLDTNKPLKTLGFDSLLAVEFRNRLESNLKLQLPATLVWNYPTIILLRQNLLARLVTDSPPTETGVQLAAASRIPDKTARSVAPNIESLSDEEAAKQLDQRLKDLEANV